MALRSWRATTVVLMAAMLLTACDSTPPPDDTTTTPPTTTTTTTSRTLAAPPVRDPLDAKDFAAEPCTSLTDAQLAELKLGAPEEGQGEDADQSNDNCTYSDFDPATNLLVYVNYYPDFDGGLSTRYLAHEGEQWDVWSPTDIDGYPAVAYRVKADRTGCDLDIGLSDTSYVNLRFFYFAWRGYEGQDTCAEVLAVGAAVLSTIRAAT